MPPGFLAAANGDPGAAWQASKSTIEIKEKLVAKSDRVKSVDIHPTETWVIGALYR